jgi:hypothetical protein
MGHVIDEALDLLENTGPEYGKGFSSHGPMAAEALLALGREDRILPWVRNYRKRLPDYPDSRTALETAHWREAMGDLGRFADWAAFFEKELIGAGWRIVLNQWVPRLAPGMVGAACHGMIRTGHAARNLSRMETAQRIRELARGLAYWASRYQSLPGIATEKTMGLKPTKALSRVELLPPEQRIRRGLIFEKVRALSGFSPFLNVIDLVDASSDMTSFFSDLFEASVRIYLASGRDRGSVITFIHAVTCAGALHLMAPYLIPDVTRIALRYCWQTSAGLYAAIGTEIDWNVYDAANLMKDGLVESAVRTNDEHAIKFTEVCLRAYTLEPKPLFLLAAQHAAQNLG